MRTLFILVLCFSFTLMSHSQYFHESLDLYYNLRSSLVMDQKVKLGFRTYSNVNFKNTIPNLLDNFQLLSRFRFNKSPYWLVRNTEYGAVFNGFVSPGTTPPDQYQHSPLHVKLHNNHGGNYMFTPGLQFIRNWYFNDTIDSRLQVGFSIRYNIAGNTGLFIDFKPFGYDLSLQFNHKFISIQFLKSVNTLYNSFTFKSSDVADVIESDRKRVSMPGEMENLSFLTLSLGNACFRLPNDSDRLLHYFYITVRRLCLANESSLSELSLNDLDYIFGFKLRYKKSMINPEYSTNRTDEGSHAMKTMNYSLLLGHTFGHITVNIGYTHAIFYQLAVDVPSLKNEKKDTLDKIIFAIDYTW